MREARQLHIILRLEAKRVGKRTGGIAPATVEKRIGHRPHLLVQQGYSAFPVAGEVAMLHGLLRQLLQLFQQSPVVMPLLPCRRPRYASNGSTPSSSSTRRKECPSPPFLISSLPQE